MGWTLNYIFAAVLAGFAIFAAPSGERFLIYVGLAASFIISCWSFVLGWLTRSGAVAAIIVGTTVFGLGKWSTVLALLFFFGSGVVISVNSGSEDGPVRRNGRQVWANGFWMMLWVLIARLTHQRFFYIAAIGALAVATADTWASELGSRRFDVTTYDVLRWHIVRPGSEGGVSGAGFIASLAGSGMVGLIWLGFTHQFFWFFAIWVAGFAGAVFDSYLGATVQEKTLFFAHFRPRANHAVVVDNDAVNAMATGFGSLLIFLIKLVFK